MMSAMRLGLQVPDFTWPGSPQSLGPTFATIARNAEASGMASFWVMDHFFQIGMVGPPENEMLEGYTALAFAAVSPSGSGWAPWSPASPTGTRACWSRR